MKTVAFILAPVMAALAAAITLAIQTPRVPTPAVKQSPSMPAPTREESAMLYALTQVESGGNYSVVSKDWQHFGAYQLSADLFNGWSPPQQDAAALSHLRELESKGFDPAAAAHGWNPNAGADYAQRVENLYTQKLSQS